MKKIYSLILCLFLLLEACAPKDIKFSDNEKDLFFQSAQTINDQITSTKITLLRCPLDSIETINGIISGCTYKTTDDSLKEKLHSLLSNRTAKPHVIIDKEYISPSFLQAQDSLAFLALSRSQWRNEISVNDFVEYILPYKQELEFVDNWRELLFSHYTDLVSADSSLCNMDSLYLYHKRHTYPSLSKHLDIKNLYPSRDNFSWLSFCSEGDCVARCLLMMYHLRAAGAPATVDYIPAWGNRPYAKHAYVGLANRSIQVEKLLENRNDPHNVVNDLNGCMTDTFMFIFPKEAIPEGLYIQYEKTIPKVYRNTWSLQEDVVEILNKVSGHEVFRNLIVPNHLDVTSQYLKTVDVELKLDLTNNHNLIYLAVFDREGWRPVAYTLIKNNKAIFKDMGKNIVYIPMVNENQNLVPVSSPFILDNEGELNFLAPDYKNKVNMNLRRKYPLFAYSANYTKQFKDAVLMGSVDSNIQLFEDIYKIAEYPFLPLTIKVNTNREYECIRLQTKNNEKARVNIFDCYTQNSLGEEKKIEGKIVRVNRQLQINFDKTTTVSKIVIWPRNDENFICKGNRYELMYWDEGWNSLGVKEGQGFSLLFDNVPANALYWLKCLTEGKEERIFTYENGKQIWW